MGFGLVRVATGPARVLIADRCEISPRVIRACRMLDLRTVALRSKAEVEGTR